MHFNLTSALDWPNMNKKMLFIDMQTHLYYIATRKTSYAMAQLRQNIQTTKPD